MSGGGWSASFQFRRAPRTLPEDAAGALGGNQVLLPILDVQLRYLGSAINMAVLLDTGADFCVLPYEVAEVLNINPSALNGKPFPMAGVGKDILVKVTNLDMTIHSNTGHKEVSMLPFLVPIEPQPPGRFVLIGRHPFLSMFDVRFRMGYTDDPELGKWTLTEVVKHRAARRYTKLGALPSPKN
jgi:hypothetical protein